MTKPRTIRRTLRISILASLALISAFGILAFSQTSAPVAAAEDEVYLPPPAPFITVEDDPSASAFGAFYFTKYTSGIDYFSSSGEDDKASRLPFAEGDELGELTPYTSWDDLNPVPMGWPRTEVWLMGGWQVAEGLDPEQAMRNVASCVADGEYQSLKLKIQSGAWDSGGDQGGLFTALDDIHDTCVNLAAQSFPYFHVAYGSDEIPSSWVTPSATKNFSAEMLSDGSFTLTGEDGTVYDAAVSGSGYVSQLPESGEAEVFLMRWACTQTVNVQELALALGVNAGYIAPGETVGLNYCLQGMSLTKISQQIDFDERLREALPPSREEVDLQRRLGMLAPLAPYLTASTFSALDSFESWQKELPRLAVATTFALIFTAFIALPTELINSTIVENRHLLDRVFSRKRKSDNRARGSSDSDDDDQEQDGQQQLNREHADPGQSKEHSEPSDIEVATESAVSEQPISARAVMKRPVLERILQPRGFWAFLVLIAATVVSAFSQPDFEFSFTNIRLLAWLFIGFVVVSVMSTTVARLFVAGSGPQFVPRMTARVDFLLILVGTVIFSRVTGMLPAIVFGTVLVVDIVSADQHGTQQQQRLLARVNAVSAIYTFIVGVGAWFAYSLLPSIFELELIAMLMMPVPEIDTVLRELFAIITVFALGVGPLAMMPISFLPGHTLFKRSKVLWGALFVVSVLLFAWVIMRLPSSWQLFTTAEATKWYAVAAVYTLFAVLFWLAFKLFRSGSRDERG